jgi:molecular chaperone DnaK (HSP70)
MGKKLAIDFGTTNSVIARWREEDELAEVIAIDHISDQALNELPPVVPSLLYVRDALNGKVTVGQTVREQGLDIKKDNRLFRNFKRGIVASPSPEPRTLDSVDFGDRDAGRTFIRHIIDHLPYRNEEIDQLVLTAPVASFEGYLMWLNEVIGEFGEERVQVVDESTAAALGYMVTKPGAVVLVFDFGGGTLDLSLVQLPESRENTGGFIKRLRKSHTSQHVARVVAKAGRIIGGSDIDQWMVMEILKRTGLTTKDLGDAYPHLLTLCEQVKIILSTEESAIFSFEAAGKTHEVNMTREELEALLEENGFFTALRRIVDKVMHVARQRGIFKEDIHYVLMVGGTSLMPSVQRTLGDYFTEMAVRADKPFTAVAEGALQVAAGFGLEDYLVHSYGLRHLDETTGEHRYDEIIPMGSRYPSEQPVELVLGASHEKQDSIEFVVGEIDTDSVAMIEVKYENGQAVFVAQAGSNEQQIVPLNIASATKSHMLANLEPSGAPGEDRLKAAFMVDDRRQLRMTVTDLKSKKTLLNDVVVVTLR